MPAAAPRGLRSTNTSRNVELVDVFSSTLATDWWLYTPTDSLRQASLSRATKQLMPTPRGRRLPHTQGGGSGLSYHVFRGAMTKAAERIQWRQDEGQGTRISDVGSICMVSRNFAAVQGAGGRRRSFSTGQTRECSDAGRCRPGAKTPSSIEAGGRKLSRGTRGKHAG